MMTAAPRSPHTIYVAAGRTSAETSAAMSTAVRATAPTVSPDAPTLLNAIDDDGNSHAALLITAGSSRMTQRIRYITPALIPPHSSTPRTDPSTIGAGGSVSTSTLERYPENSLVNAIGVLVRRSITATLRQQDTAPTAA